MRMKQVLRLCVMLSLAGTFTTATAQLGLPPCNSLPSGERESAQAIGACREGPPIADSSAKKPLGVLSGIAPVPNVVGLSFDDARSRLGNFNVRRSYVPSHEPGGTVLEQQPAPPARLGAGGIVRVIVSDGSLRPAPQVPVNEIDGMRTPAAAPPSISTPRDAAKTVPSRANDPVTQATASKSAAAGRSTAARSGVGAERAKAAQTPARKAVAQRPAPVIETLELPNVIGRTSADATAALAEFKVERIEVVANAAPSGQVLAQDPAPGTPVPPGAAIGLQVSDGSLASVGAAASTIARPAPEPTASTGQIAPTAPTVAPPPATASVQTRAPTTFPSTAVLLLIAGVLVGLGLGALLMRRWFAQRQVDTDAFVPTVVPPSVPAETSRESVAQAVEPVALTASPLRMAPVTFAAHLEEGETKVEFASAADAEEMTLEYSRDFHE